MNNHTLHFSIGPVQGFVAQARRTRDLWAGSFVLSWLAGHALAAVRKQGGEIAFPAVAKNGNVSDPLLAAIEGRTLPDDPYPRIGSLPNRFKASVTREFDAAQVTAAVRDAWRGLAEAVWQHFVEPVTAHGNETRTIWDRQIESFWEMTWVMGEDPGDGSDAAWMEARKNWRQRWPESEGGDHCSLMSDFQELSGYIRARDGGRQKAFWKALGERTGTLELRDGERLCAIALVKRLFPRLPKKELTQTIGWIPGGKPETIGNWPSTAYLAAIPWLREFVADESRKAQLRTYQDNVVAAAGKAVGGERATQVASLQPLGELAWMDGNFFHPAALANAGDTPLREESARTDLLKQLRALQGEHPAQPYYALLVLDGDSLGKHLRKGNASDISTQLATFSHSIYAIVARHDGVTLYAGGDDVLALLPMDTALDAALALREAYAEAFDNDPVFSASAAIVYAHYRLPLRALLAEAHHQLNAVAKDGNGRDSLALAWFKASGKAAQWVSTWRDADGASAPAQLTALANQVRDGGFGGGFFYHLRARYPMLDVRSDAGKHNDLSGTGKMLQAEYMKSRESAPTRAQAESAIAALFDACKLSRRDDQGAWAPQDTRLQFDGLRLARLLAGKEARA